MKTKEIQALKDQIYKDSKLLDTLFNNISFNLRECTDCQEEQNTIAKARRIIEKGMVSNMLKIASLDDINQQETDLLDAVNPVANDKKGAEFLGADLLSDGSVTADSKKSK